MLSHLFFLGNFLKSASPSFFFFSSSFLSRRMREQGYSRLQNDPDAQQQQQQQHRGGKQGQCPTWIRAFSILLLAACVACGLVIPIVVLFAGASSLPNQMSSQRLMVHLTRLENVAAANGGSRAPWTGYNASLAYVEKVAFFLFFF